MLFPDISPIVPLAEASRCSKAGRKAAGLARLLEGGYQVPEGFVINADCYRAHLWASGARALAIGATEAEERVQIRNAILDTDIPADVWQAISNAYEWLSQNCKSRVAVRASAIEFGRQQIHFPGAYETFLNVSGTETLKAAIKRVWASTWGGKAAAYRYAMLDRARSFEKIATSDGNASSGQGTTLRPSNRSEPAMAVIVQRMIEADLFGTATTANTVTGDPTRVSVEVYSARNPSHSQHCEYDLRTCNVLGTIDLFETVSMVAEKAMLVEELFNCPVEIEWLIKEDQLWLIQARRLTNLPEFFPTVSTAKKLDFAQWRRICTQPVSHFSRSLFANPYCNKVLTANGYVYIPDCCKKSERMSAKEVSAARKLVLDWQHKVAPKLRSRIDTLSTTINMAHSIDSAHLFTSLEKGVDIIQSTTKWFVDLHVTSLRFQNALRDLLTDNKETKDGNVVYATLMSGMLDAYVTQEAQIQDFAIRAAAALDTGKMEYDQWRQAFAREIAFFIKTTGYSYRNVGEVFDLAIWKSWQEDPHSNDLRGE